MTHTSDFCKKKQVAKSPDFEGGGKNPYLVHWFIQFWLTKNSYSRNFK